MILLVIVYCDIVLVIIYCDIVLVIVLYDSVIGDLICIVLGYVMIFDDIF